jgi:alpha/beta superfamily hydrolase
MDRMQSVTFPSAGDNPVQLEGLFHLVQGPGQWPTAVICHPHPQGGGTMHNGVVRAVAHALVERGVLALRFNFRGVEESGGRYDRGRGEQDDVAGALQWLLKQPEVDPWHVTIVGYSFGAWVGLHYAQRDPRVIAVAAIGLVAWDPGIDLRRANLWQETRHFDPGFLASFTRPKLFVSGEHDAFTPPAVLRDLVDRIPAPKELHIVHGTDHFFQGREQDVGELVASFVAEL